MFRVLPTKIHSGLGQRRFLSLSSQVAKARRVLLPKFPLKAKPGRSVRIELAEYSDLETIDNFSHTHFAPLERSAHGVGVDPQVFYDQLLLPIIETCLRFPYSTLAFDGDELVGYHLMNMDRFDEKTYTSPRDVDDFEFLKEKACTAYNVTDENLKFMATVLYYAIHMTPHYLPKREGGQVVAHGEMVCVRKDYKGNALIGALLQQGCVAVQEHGFAEYYMGNSTSLATNHACVDLGAEKLWEFMYKDVKFNGVHVFNKGTISSDEFIALNLGRVEDIVKNDFIQRHTAGLA